MKTIRRKISAGFIALSLVLFCAVIINIFEITRLEDSTEEVIAEGSETAEYATEMLNALQKQNRAVLNMIILGESASSAEYHNGVYELNAVILTAMEKHPTNAALSAIYDANIHYHDIVERHSLTSNYDDKAWFTESYVEAYYSLDRAIKSYMTSTKSSVAARMTKLENSVYKTMTPSILTLLVAMLILMLFHFFIDTYYTKPVSRISRALDNYLKNKVPYQVKLEEKSELSSLNDNIIEIIGHIKKQQ